MPDHFIDGEAPREHPVVRLEFLLPPQTLDPESRDRLVMALHDVADGLARGRYRDRTRLLLTLPA